MPGKSVQLSWQILARGIGVCKCQGAINEYSKMETTPLIQEKRLEFPYTALYGREHN